ncbi:MAG: sulfite exporter TauE/SafE family protein [Kiritimatiellia bacterium]
MEILSYALAGLSAILVGLSRTGLPGVGILAIPLMALADEQARMSVGKLLPLLIFADLLTLFWYRKHGEARIILRLIPWIALGYLPGHYALRYLPESAFRPFLGVMILILLGLDAWRLRKGWHHLPHHPAFILLIGILVGFSTMVANAAGPIITIYWLANGLGKERFAASSAWLFLVINTSKIPFYGHLGLLSWESVRASLLFAPLVVAGLLFGRRILHRIRPAAFNRNAIVLAALSALILLVP